MNLASVLLLSTALCAGVAHAAEIGTQIDLTFHGFNLSRFGGPITDVTYSLLIPDLALDQAPSSPNISQFVSHVTVESNGTSFSPAFGAMQLRLSTSDEMTFTFAYPGKQFPGYVLNT